ncbi:DUF4260 domain-containing protein [Nibrella viscosa]|uniref:DUF4260 domain-containing protein n=1 Tax=Nibrella viscosa TaxID=1084524 RepID=A0ABP8JT64_9BACT
MKTILSLEELVQFIVSLVLFGQLPFAWWWFPALILLPDIGMLGYLVNPRLGAYLYNIFHHKGIALLSGVTGLLMHQPVLMLTGVILFGHAAMDRTMGYGLKYTAGFKQTHLGTLN